MVRALELIRSYRADPTQTLEDVREALERGRAGRPGGLRPDDFSIRDLAATFITDRDGEPIGLWELERRVRERRLLEADGAITSTSFLAITNLILQSVILEGYTLPEFRLSQIVPTITGKARQAQVNGVTLPLSQGKSLQVPEGEEFAAVAVYAEYVKTQQVVKKGAYVPITYEAILADETGQIVSNARRLGEVIGLEKETALVEYVTGLVANCVIEKRVGDSSETTSNLFLTAGRWVNQQANPLTDWTDLDDAENLFLGITMPGTGNPPLLVERFVLVPQQLQSTARRILTAVETRSGSSNVVVAGNPLADRGIQLVWSPLVYTRQLANGVSGATAAGTWFYGDLRRAFAYYEIQPLQVLEDTSGEARFTHDIAFRFRASEIGVPVAMEPRMWSKQVPS